MQRSAGQWVALTVALVVAAGTLHAEENFCWKSSYTRGVGSIGGGCPTGYEKQGLLCYPACPAGFQGAGPLCWQACPAGFTDIGVSCAKPKPVSTPGYPWKIGDRVGDYDTGPRARCEAANGVGNCYRSGLIWYPRCPASYRPVGDNICSPVCPAGMRDDGAFCAKTTQTRTAGQPGCPAGMVADAGLCYPVCTQDFQGVGPVCWGKCGGSYPFGCGAGCARDSASCTAAVVDMVENTVGAALSILGMIVGTPGVGAALKSAATAGKTAAKAIAVEGAEEIAEAAGKAAAKAAAKAFLKQFLKTNANNLLDPGNIVFNTFKGQKIATLMILNRGANEFGEMKEEKTFDYEKLTIMDPTGVAAAIVSFAKYPACDIDPFVASTNSLDFGNIAAPASQTVKISVQRPTTFTHITTPPLTSCSIQPESDCVGRTMQPGQSCTVTVKASAGAKLRGEVRLYTTELHTIPYAIQVLANSNAPQSCQFATTTDEAVNLTSVAGVWAWNNDLNHKILIDTAGRITPINNWTGGGTVTVVDGVQRNYQFQFGGGSAVLQLSEFAEKLSTTGMQATRRNWDARCEAGLTWFAGLCYDVPIGYEMTTPGFAGVPCPTSWRDDGTSCWPPWTGPNIPDQAQQDGPYTYRFPIMVTNCPQLGNNGGAPRCPPNFFGAHGCSCAAKTMVKNVVRVQGRNPVR